MNPFRKPQIKTFRRPKTYEEGIAEGRRLSQLEAEEVANMAVQAALKVVESKAYERGCQYTLEQVRQLTVENGWINK